METECTYHPGVAVAGTCANCCRPFCRSCLVELKGKSYCRPCVSAGAGIDRESASELAVASLILSAASLALCGLTAVPGMIIGFIELGKINRGESPEAGRGMAKAGAIIGAVMTGFVVLSVLAAIAVMIIAIIIAILAAS